MSGLCGASTDTGALEPSCESVFEETVKLYSGDVVEKHFGSFA